MRRIQKQAKQEIKVFMSMMHSICKEVSEESRAMPVSRAEIVEVGEDFSEAFSADYAGIWEGR